jgi:hypothetical protein
LILIWAQKQDEPELQAAFQRTIAVRKLNPEARQLADMYFFETLVRVHRRGEGEPYSGLKPAGRNLGPVIPAADKAIDTGLLEPLLRLLPAMTHAEIRERFNAAIARKNYDKDDVESGRAYVRTYVDFIHYVEEIHDSPEHAARDQHTAHKAAPAKDAHAIAAHREIKEEAEMGFKFPGSLKTQHQELHSELAKATTAGGRIGEAAKEVARLLHPHLVKEEEYGMPPLALLPALVAGKLEPEMSKFLEMTEKLKADLPAMLKEHKAIVAALESLVFAAKAENKPEYEHFAEKLMLHAQTEEEVLYPTSILIGEYLKLVLKK